MSGKPSSRLKHSERAKYLEFIMSEEVQSDLNKIPPKEHLKYLQEQFKIHTDIYISYRTQLRIKQASDAGKITEIKGKFYII
jgi:hypothetical protein